MCMFGFSVAYLLTDADDPLCFNVTNTERQTEVRVRVTIQRNDGLTKSPNQTREYRTHRGLADTTFTHNSNFHIVSFQQQDLLIGFINRFDQ